MIDKIIKPLLIFIGLIFIMGSVNAYPELIFYETSNITEDGFCYDLLIYDGENSYVEAYITVKDNETSPSILEGDFPQFTGRYSDCYDGFSPDSALNPNSLWLILNYTSNETGLTSNYSFNAIEGYGEKIEGCMDSYSNNYNSNANVNVGCEQYNPILEYYYISNLTEEGFCYNYSLIDGFNQFISFIITLKDNETSPIIIYDTDNEHLTGNIQNCYSGFPPEFALNPNSLWLIFNYTSIETGLTSNYSFNAIEGYVLLVEGCMDNTAINYNPNANFDDGTCEYIIEGCMDNTAINYNPNANFDDGTCEYQVIDETENTDGFFNSFLSDVGNGLGSFLSSVSVPIMYLILVLAIGSAIVGVIYSITNLVRGKMK